MVIGYFAARRLPSGTPARTAVSSCGMATRPRFGRIWISTACSCSSCFRCQSWETGQWLRSVKVRALRGKGWLLLSGFLIAVGLIVGSVAAAMTNYQVALIVVPLVAWIAVLFFRPGQSTAMQFVLVISALALALTLAVEIIVLDWDAGASEHRL